MDKIKITYEIDDGYCGGSRPHHVSIDPLDYQGLDDPEIANQLENEIMDDFNQRISPVYPESDIIAEIIVAIKDEADKTDGVEN